MQQIRDEIRSLGETCRQGVFAAIEALETECPEVSDDPQLRPGLMDGNIEGFALRPHACRASALAVSVDMHDADAPVMLHGMVPVADARGEARRRIQAHRGRHNPIWED